MEDINKMKVADLKKELKLRGLAITGVKQELIDRLEEALQSDAPTIAEGADDDEFDEDEILETPKPAAAKRRVSIKRATDTPTKGTPVKAAKVAKATTNGVVEKPVPVTKEPVAETNEKDAKMDVDAADEDESGSKVPGSKEGTTPKSTEKVDKKKSRAERFGIVLSSSTQIAARTERFGVVSNGTAKTEADLGKLKTRADRFGEVTAKSLKATESSPKTEADMGKLKTRADRFGEVTAKSLTKIDDIEKKKAREERFTEEKENTESVPEVKSISTTGKSVITAPVKVAGPIDSTKSKRAERFGL